MAQAIEARVPFLGMSHAKLANQLPLSWRLSNDDEKMALRAAADLTSLPKKSLGGQNYLPELQQPNLSF